MLPGKLPSKWHHMFTIEKKSQFMVFRRTEEGRKEGEGRKVDTERKKQ